MGAFAKLVRIMWVPVVLFLCYTGWVIWQHYHSGAPPARVPSDPMAAYGTSVKILHFYGPREIAPGAKAMVCYGVVNANAVELDPPVEKVWPAVSRCFNVTPAKGTRYTLTAEGTNHTRVSSSIEIAVKP